MKKAFHTRAFSCFVLTIVAFTNLYGQDTTVNAYDDLSLKDLLNVKIVSVSKRAESLIEAPLSASVVTREEIKRVGCTSIMEALRLVPGMIVREESNGNYDIHLRGMDNVPPNASFDITATTILVMINNRPIYSYLRGGTFWETLPVDLNDVERIEIIRGPAAALYGPNAVNGVINIITRQAKKDGLYTLIHSQQGSYHTFINNGTIGYKSNKFNMLVSGNYQHRARTQTSYFEFNRNTRLDNPAFFINFQKDTVKNINVRYPRPGLAMEKYAGNVFLNYNLSEKLNISLTGGAQHSLVQKVSTENEVTPLSTAFSQTKYIDFHANLCAITAQVSYNEGKQITDYDPGNIFDFHTFDANLEYSFVKGNFSLKPGVSYRSAVYDDTRYSDTTNKTGIFNSRGKITTQAAWLRGEYKLFNSRLRLVAGLMGNKFNYPDTIYLSYELAATYKIGKKRLIRAVYSRAPRSSTIFDTYVDQRVVIYPTGYKKYSMLTLLGNKNLRLLIADMFEIGYRGNITPRLSIDLEIFHTNAQNYNTLTTSNTYTKMNGSDTINITPIISTNIPLKWRQQGATVSLSYSSSKWQLKPFVTLQRSRIKNYSPFNNTPDAGTPGAVENNIYSGMGTDQKVKSTPSAFGGASANYTLSSKINVSVTAYYYSSQTYNHLSNALFNDGIRGIDHINGKMILNAGLAFEPIKNLYLTCSAKNLLNNSSREFFHADDVPFMLIGGIHYEF